jgi:two-component system chemotaxis response regulator CheY
MATVMVVDDSKTVRSYHGSILRDLGVNVLEAENGMEALEKTLDNKIDLYLVDVNMPVMDGYSFVSELRKQPQGKLIPVIMITTQEAATDKLEAFKVGANLFETKPIKPDALKGYLQLLLKATI